MDVFDIINSYYGENGALRSILLTHSGKVAEKALAAARNHPLLPLDRDFVFAASMLHDIGIVRCDAPGILCFGTEPYMRHGLCGAEMLRMEGWDKHFPAETVEGWARVCERHTGTGLTREDIRREKLPLPDRDFLPETLEEKLVCYADNFFSKTRPGEEKTLRRVMSSVRGYSEESYRRFLALHEIFG